MRPFGIRPVRTPQNCNRPFRIRPVGTNPTYGVLRICSPHSVSQIHNTNEAFRTPSVIVLTEAIYVDLYGISVLQSEIYYD